MSILTPAPKTSIEIFQYPTYTLMGRIRVSDVEKYQQTLDDSLIIYKYCENGVKNISEYKIPDASGRHRNPRF